MGTDFMIKNFTPILFLIILISSCSKENPEIRTLSSLTNNDEYLIKWETFPQIKGEVKIFSSLCPETFDPKSEPILKENTTAGVVLVPPYTEGKRSYYKLIFNNKYSTITTDRVIHSKTIFNFRDLGGYNTCNNDQIKWGKIYRSGSLYNASPQDIDIINELGIKTIVDLRLDADLSWYAYLFNNVNIINLPFRGNKDNVFFDQILSGKMTREDILKYLQDFIYFIVENNPDYLEQVFDILLDEANYPIVFSCPLGKDRTAVVSAIILAALNVDQSLIIEDYLLSNDLIDYYSQIQGIEMFDTQTQETFTALFSAHREVMNYTFERISEDFGSLENYLKNELKLTPEKRNKLKEILLYNNLQK
jgi:Protein tyrosine/serine phosphatase